MLKIMIVEDDPTIARLLCAGLCRWGYDAFACEALEDVEAEFLRTAPHMVLMDCTLPYFNGYYWCERIRRHSTAPMARTDAVRGPPNSETSPSSSPGPRTV